MTVCARCWTCDLDFTSPEAWRVHDAWHQSRGEVECLRCGELLPRRSLGFHPCARRLFAAAPAAAAEGSVPGTRPAARHLSAVRDCAPSANSKEGEQ